MDDYQVGYGNPPKDTMFARGRSGNPKGRPKGSKSVASILHAVTRELIHVTENGKRKNVTKMEALLRQLMTKAMSGDIRAMKEILFWDRTFESSALQAVLENPDREKDAIVMRRMLTRLRSVGTGEHRDEPITREEGTDEPIGS